MLHKCGTNELMTCSETQVTRNIRNWKFGSFGVPHKQHGHLLGIEPPTQQEKKKFLSFEQVGAFLEVC